MFPVGYYDYKENSLVLIPLHRWWKNLQGDAPVVAWLKGKRYEGVANAFQGDQATMTELQHLIAGSSNLLRVYKIERNEAGVPQVEQVRRVARTLSLVRIHFAEDTGV